MTVNLHCHIIQIQNTVSLHCLHLIPDYQVFISKITQNVYVKTLQLFSRFMRVYMPNG